MRLTERSMTRKREQDERLSAPRISGPRTTGAPTAHTRLTDVPEITEYAMRHQANKFSATGTAHSHQESRGDHHFHQGASRPVPVATFHPHGRGDDGDRSG